MKKTQTAMDPSESTPSNGTTSSVPKKILPNPSQVQGLASWIVNPLQAVGSKTSNLLSTPSAVDSVSRAGCGSTYFTSWESFSRSYVSCIECSPPVRTSRKKRETLAAGTGVDTPTPEELAMFTRLQRDQLKRGGVFIRSTGEILSPAQAKTKKGMRKITSALRDREASTSDTNPSDEDNLLVAEPPAPPPAFPPPPQPQINYVRDRRAADENAAGDPAATGDTARATVLPVRTVTTTTWRPTSQEGMHIPYSAQFTQIASRLSDPSATGALGAVVRGSAIRDGASLISLARHLQVDSGSVMDIAPVFKLACMGLSVSQENYQSDPIQYRVVRGFSSNVRGTTVISATTPAPPPAKIIAMGVDSYTAFMIDKMPTANLGDPFTYQNADVAWTAVPVRSSILSQPWATAFIASFLSGNLWAGRVNHVIEGHYYSGDGSSDIVANLALMPACNSVSIPGPTNVILVLLDSSTMYSQTGVRIGNVDVPIYRDNNAQPIDPADFSAIFMAWFNTNNVPNIPHHCASAINEFSTLLGVENTVNLGLAMAAEVYAAQYQGLSLPVTGDPPDIDYSQSAGGGWSFHNNETIKDTKVKLGYLGTDWDKNSRKITGYNMTSISSWSLPPSGIAKAEALVLGKYQLNLWSDTDLLKGGDPGQLYTITAVNSVTRVAIGMTLISTHSLPTYFPYGGGFGTWMHMYSGAMCAQTATIFCDSNINLSIWTGYNVAEDSVFSSSYMEQIIPIATNGFASYVRFAYTLESLANLGFDDDMLGEYYGIPVLTDPDWMSNHPLPFYFAVQWMQKHSSFRGDYPKHAVNWYHDGKVRIGLEITRDSASTKVTMVGSPNIEAYCPVVTAECILRRELTHMNIWFDQFALISNHSAFNYHTAKPKILTSQTFVLSPVDSGLDGTPDMRMYVFRSAYENFSSELQEARFSPLQYPDPISLKDMIEGAKHWIVYPGLSALGGYLTGGPLGAVAAGGGHLIKNVLDKISSPTSERIIETAHKTLEAATAVPPATTSNPVQALANMVMSPDQIRTLPLTPTPATPSPPLVPSSTPPPTPTGPHQEVTSQILTPTS